MEQLRAELSHLLGEKLSRIECVNEKADTALWALYDSRGNPMPLMARSFSTPRKLDSWHGKPPCWPGAGLFACRLSTEL